jgi:hypothetical protein
MNLNDIWMANLKVGRFGNKRRYLRGYPLAAGNKWNIMEKL